MSRKKYKKKKKLEKLRNKSSKTQRIIAGALMVISCLIGVGIQFIYRYIQGQYLMLKKPEVILFITEVKWINFPFYFLTIILLIIGCEDLLYYKFDLRKKWKIYRIYFIVLILPLIMPLVSINARYDILESGIYKYSVFGKKTISYSWSEVSEAKAFVTTSYYHKGDYFEYSIKLNDGKVLKLGDDGQSKDFWYSLNLIDNILKRNHVQIYRDKGNLDKLEEGEYREKVEKFIY